jgi:hypothetical protein
MIKPLQLINNVMLFPQEKMQKDPQMADCPFYVN